MSETCPTVRIKVDNDEGFAVINESDFDPKKHTLFVEAGKSEAPAAKPAKRSHS